MTRDLFWFIKGKHMDAEMVEALLYCWFSINNKLDSHLNGTGFSEGAD